MEEITEKLLPETNSGGSGGTGSPKKSSKKTMIIVAVIVIVLCLAAAAAFGVTQYLHKRLWEDLQEGQKLMEQKDYSNALGKYQEAVKIDKSSIEGYLGLAQCAVFVADTESAKQAYNKLYELTNQNKYKIIADNIAYGNTGGNLNNGGNVCISGENIYIVDNGTRSAKIWLINNGATELLDTVDLESSTPVKDLNAWGGKLYMLVGTVPYTYDLLSGTLNKMNVDKNGMMNLMIYNGKLYYSSGFTGTFRANLDGSNPEQILDQHGWLFIILNDNIYIVSTDMHGSYSKLTRVSLSDFNDKKEIFNETNKLVMTMAGTGSKIYYQLIQTANDVDDPNWGKYLNDIYVLDTSNDQYSVLMSPRQVASVNCDSSNLYYVANGKFYQCGLDGKNPIEIGAVSKPSSPGLGYGRIGYSIATTPFDIYLTASNASMNTVLGLDNTIMSTVAYSDKPASEYKAVNLSTSHASDTENKITPGTHRYEYLAGDVTWNEAVEYAKEKGGYLAHVDSQEEFNIIVNGMDKARDNGSRVLEYYIGGRRNYTDHNYKWVDEDGVMYGDPVNASLGSWFWLSGEPSYQDPNEPTYEESVLSIMYINNSDEWVGNDTVTDIVGSFSEFAGRVGYVIEYED